MRPKVNIALASAFLFVTGSASGNLAKEYDYVIVGGGTAGLVLANRLTEDRRSEFRNFQQSCRTQLS